MSGKQAIDKLNSNELKQLTEPTAKKSIGHDHDHDGHHKHEGHHDGNGSGRHGKH